MSSTTPGHLEAFRATGSSPGGSPTLHLLGPGRVGRALLRALPPGLRLVAVSDTSGTLRDPDGLDPLEVVGLKLWGGRLADHPGAGDLTPAPSGPFSTSDTGPTADVVVDTTATSFDRPGWASLLETEVLEQDRRLVLAAKDALCSSVHRWLDRPDAVERLGLNAVLGGTGALFQEELQELREGWSEVALAGNASTTAVLQAVERGVSLEEGIREADRLGLLEADPELDLRGDDGAVKVAIVAGALLGFPVRPGDVPAQHLRDVDVRAVRRAARDGRTTRLVGRIRRDGELSLAYEELPLGSPLAVPRDRVAYGYRLENDWRYHFGAGLGPAATAAAVARDLVRLTGAASDAGTAGDTGTAGHTGSGGVGEVRA